MLTVNTDTGKRTGGGGQRGSKRRPLREALLLRLSPALPPLAAPAPATRVHMSSTPPSNSKAGTPDSQAKTAADAAHSASAAQGTVVSADRELSASTTIPSSAAASTLTDTSLAASSSAPALDSSSRSSSGGHVLETEDDVIAELETLMSDQHMYLSAAQAKGEMIKEVQARLARMREESAGSQATKGSASPTGLESPFKGVSPTSSRPSSSFGLPPSFPSTSSLSSGFPPWDPTLERSQPTRLQDESAVPALPTPHESPSQHRAVTLAAMSALPKVATSEAQPPTSPSATASGPVEETSVEAALEAGERKGEETDERMGEEGMKAEDRRE
ncbi:hypothetical protein JCM8097_001249 [Rhodosporidiobolus ruineniae]